MPNDQAIDAGAPEIEITPAMLKAGLKAYRERDSRVMSDKEIVEDIYLSMVEAGFSQA